MTAFEDLVAIVARLRSAGGCPWDRAQTPASMRPYLLEETYEVLDAIDRGDDADLRRELGDLVFLAFLYARMAEERGAFGIEHVLEDIAEKMRRRHPHVFDPGHAVSGDEGSIASWEARKAKERSVTRSTLDGVPRSLPALLRAHRVSEKASRVGFDWKDRAGVREKLREELAELDEALSSGEEAAIAHEFGDVLLVLANLGRFLSVDAEDALRAAVDRFEDRFRKLETSLTADGRTLHGTDMETLEAYWQRVKRERPC